MELPEILTVTALDQKTSLPAEGLAIVVELFASRKNDYIVGPAISDFSGQVKFTRDECERSVKSDQQMFLMDYVGDISDCAPYLEIRLHAPEHIARMLQQYQMSPAFWGKRFQDAAKLFKALEHVKNASFEPASIRLYEVQLLANPNITMRMSRRS
jgi:hypothetical protein